MTRWKFEIFKLHISSLKALHDLEQSLLETALALEGVQKQLINTHLMRSLQPNHNHIQTLLSQQQVSCFRVTPQVVFTMFSYIPLFQCSPHDQYLLNIVYQIREYFESQGYIGAGTSHHHYCLFLVLFVFCLDATVDLFREVVGQQMLLIVVRQRPVHSQPLFSMEFFCEIIFIITDGMSATFHYWHIQSIYFLKDFQTGKSSVMGRRVASGGGYSDQFEVWVTKAEQQGEQVIYSWVTVHPD